MQVKDLDNRPQGIRLQDLKIRDYFIPINNKDNKIFVLDSISLDSLEIGVFEEDGIYVEPYTYRFTKDSLVERVYIKKIEFTREDTRNA